MAGTMAAVTTGVMVVKNLFDGITAYNNNLSQADAAATNAKISDYNAFAVRKQGSIAVDALLSKGRKEISKQTVAALQGGAAGGTNDNIITKSNINLMKDIKTTEYNYETKAMDYLNQGKMYRYQRDVYRNNATNSLTSGFLGAAAAPFQVYSATKLFQ